MLNLSEFLHLDPNFKRNSQNTQVDYTVVEYLSALLIVINNFKIIIIVIFLSNDITMMKIFIIKRGLLK